VGDDSALAYQLPKTLKELEGAARSIRLLLLKTSQDPRSKGDASICESRG
jgi:hypothetical protein